MLEQPHVEPPKKPSQGADPTAAAPQSIEDSIASYVLGSDHTSKHYDKIAAIRGAIIPLERFDILSTDAKECQRLAIPSTWGERILEKLGTQSDRQAKLISRAADIQDTIRKAELNNATQRLKAATLVESTYRELFMHNRAMRKSIDLLSTCLEIGDNNNSESTRLHRAYGSLEITVRANFHSLGMKVDSKGWIPEENYWAIKDAQNVLVESAQRADACDRIRQQRAVENVLPEMGCLSNTTITSVDGKVVVPCDIGAEAMLSTARDLNEALSRLYSSQDRRDAIKAMCEAEKLVFNFRQLAGVALEKVKNTENEIRRYCQKALFPDVKGLALLEAYT